MPQDSHWYRALQIALDQEPPGLWRVVLRSYPSDYCAVPLQTHNLVSTLPSDVRFIPLLNKLPGLILFQSGNTSEPEATVVYTDPDVPSDGLVSVHNPRVMP